MSGYDVNIQIVPAVQYNGTGFYSFGQTRSLGVRGIQKLVNVYAKCLLTPVGSDPTDLTYGTILTNLIGSNVGLDDAREILLTSLDTATLFVRGMQAADTGVPDDERLATVTLTDFIFIEEAPGFAAQIFIQNVANQGLTFLLPTLTVKAD